MKRLLIIFGHFRSPSPKPRTPIPSSAADIYRETIQGLRAFKPQEKPVVEGIFSWGKNFGSPNTKFLESPFVYFLKSKLNL